MTAKEIKEAAMQLTRAQRAKLALDLSQSVLTPDPDVEKAWIKEIDRRVKEFDSGHVKARPLAAVLRRIRGRKK